MSKISQNSQSQKLNCISMDSNVESFYKISQCSSDLKESLSNNSLKEDDINNIIERHIAASYNENAAVCDFIEGADWLNVSDPLSLYIHLRNKIVVLDFWTYCCINCLHMLPELKKLEETYSIANGVVFIGVHSAKFDHERDAENVRNAVLRHNVTHPVINDHGAMWSALGITCWPTLLVLAPNCRPLYIQIGEGGMNILDRYIQVCLKYFTAELEKSDLNISRVMARGHSNTSKKLNYPGKVSTYKGKDSVYMAISDSANNRIIVLKDNYILKVIGGSRRGYKDSDLETALFANPQGVVIYNENIIFVADCENHCIRKLDLLQNKVVTVAGNGTRIASKVDELEANNSEMRSPWGLALHWARDHTDETTTDNKKKAILFIAMAGKHQIWALFLDTCTWWKKKTYTAGSCVVISGTGNEENRNNSYPMSAAFAQPSGLSINSEDNEMYIADSESSTIRRMSLLSGKVSLVVGGERDPFNLFAYGDLDGTLTSAKLKHPLDVAWSVKHNCLFVADTFNNKIRKVDVKTNTMTTLSSAVNNQIALKEPGGLCLDPNEDYLFIADTNNHCIKRLNIRDNSNNILSIDFEKLQRKTDAARNVMRSDTIFHKDILVGNLSHVSFSIRFIETSIKLNRDVKQNWKVRVGDNRNTVLKQETFDNIFKVTLELDEHCVTDNVQMMFRLALCTGEICFMKMFTVEYTVQCDKCKIAPFKNLTENTLITIDNNEVKVISSLATTA